MFHPSLASANLPVTVLKFGGSVLAGPDTLAAAVTEVERTLTHGHRVVAVTSAFAGVTARLSRKARERFGSPAPNALASLLATGESRAAAFLSLALEDAGIRTALLDPDRVALQVRGPCLDGEPFDVDLAAFHKALGAALVAVLPGFFGRRRDGSIALFGRGGSDLTALFLADRLDAEECRLIKNVDGLYDRDPASGAPDRSRRYRSANLDDLASVGGELVQAKAIVFAREHRVPFTIAKPLSNTGGTRIGTHTAVPFLPALDPPEGEAASGVLKKERLHPAERQPSRLLRDRRAAVSSELASGGQGANEERPPSDEGADNRPLSGFFEAMRCSGAPSKGCSPENTPGEGAEPSAVPEPAAGKGTSRTAVRSEPVEQRAGPPEKRGRVASDAGAPRHSRKNDRASSTEAAS